MQKINTKVLVSGADYFTNHDAINSYMDDHELVDLAKAKREHAEIVQAFKSAGIEVAQVPPPEACQDGVYTANWALVVGNKAIMANLPNKRQPEEPYAEAILRASGKEIINLPKDLIFSGQGDALRAGNYLFVGSNYRTDPKVHDLLAEITGLEVIGVQAVPETDQNGQPVINPVTNLPDSFFYDLDLALAVISPKLIAWCPEAFLPESRAKIEAIADLEKIEVSLKEATKASACNLVSTGETVVMSARAPSLQSELEKRGLKIIAPDVSELMKGGGFIRCTSLTLDYF